jgi:hypothetical protein
VVVNSLRVTKILLKRLQDRCSKWVTNPLAVPVKWQHNTALLGAAFWGKFLNSWRNPPQLHNWVLTVKLIPLLQLLLLVMPIAPTILLHSGCLAQLQPASP